jgi:hypothetical protein
MYLAAIALVDRFNTAGASSTCLVQRISLRAMGGAHRS